MTYAELLGSIKASNGPYSWAVENTELPLDHHDDRSLWRKIATEIAREAYEAGREDGKAVA